MHMNASYLLRMRRCLAVCGRFYGTLALENGVLINAYEAYRFLSLLVVRSILCLHLIF